MLTRIRRLGPHLLGAAQAECRDADRQPGFIRQLLVGPVGECVS
jgi:uncharacterized protein (UPF0264 family)